MRRTLFALFPLLLVLAVAEVVGRVFTIPDDTDGMAFPRSLPGAAFAERGPGMFVARFQSPKSAVPFSRDPVDSVPRVLVFGESSVHGGVRGLPPPAEFPALLIGRMKATGGPVEVLNFGNPGVEMGGIVKIAQEAVAFRPDVVVLYTGHNDVGNRTMRVLAPQGRREPPPRWRELGVGRLLHWGLSIVIPPAPAALPEVLDQDVRSGFGSALDTFLGLWEEAGVPVILATPASDVWHWWVGTPVCPGVSRPLWNVASNGRWKLRDAVPVEVAERLHAAAPDCPETAFALGRSRYNAGDVKEGLALLRAARDADPRPLRANATILTAIRARGARPGVTLVDVEDAWGLAGRGVEDRFHDLVHLTRAGHAGMADTLAPALAEVLGEWKAGATRSPHSPR